MLSYRLTLIAALSLASLGGAAVLAVGDNGNAHADMVMTPAAEKPEASGKPADAGTQGSAHLAAAQLKACQKRETAINNIMARVVERGTKQVAVFDTIATRTEAFYTSKGMTISNYAALVASVDAAKAKTKADLAAMKTTGTLNCAAANPKGVVKAFQSNLKTEISDLKTYKTAVKNLIVAVKSVKGTDSSSEKTGPTASPAANRGGGQ